MEVLIDIEKFEDFITSEEFTRFLVNNTDFEIAAAVLQILMDKLNEMKK